MERTSLRAFDDKEGRQIVVTDAKGDVGLWVLSVVQKQRILSADPTLPDELVRSWRHLVDLPQFRENKPQHDVQDSEITVRF